MTAWPEAVTAARATATTKATSTASFTGGIAACLTREGKLHTMADHDARGARPYLVPVARPGCGPGRARRGLRRALARPAAGGGHRAGGRAAPGRGARRSRRGREGDDRAL